VVITVTGANSTTMPATDDDGNGVFDGIYVGAFTPQGYGADQVTVTIEGQTVGTESISTAPRPADPAQSLVSAPDGRVDSPTTVSVAVKNTAGEAYDYGDIRPLTVLVTVSGANTATFAATDPDLDGTYQGSYTPAFPGTDQIGATINGSAVGNTATSQVAPLSGPLTVQVSISGGAPSDGLPVIVYQGTNPTPFLGGTTDATGKVTFPDVVFGPYTVHLPKRDFDVQFAAMTRSIDLTQTTHTVTFTGTTQTLRAGASVWRVRSGGSGNAFQYVVGGRSWVSANNQVQNDLLLGVTGHLATIHSVGENAFVATLVAKLCPNETNPSRCKYQGWIGLSDTAVQGSFRWVTGEALTFTRWAVGEPSGKNNEDHVEIDLTGFWSDTNGASSTNEGYVVEWKVTWPLTPPF
jgi:hypothetical protein